ncbi:MarR family winged helix-turn-helix transcriptional regulator [Comamonas sp. Y33R10-2]|nr:MarR family winged helix-turn-helix transcriptional regulator [Comamonas sp. Y33R10-2]QXZ11335.1 MarR family winged helix-turn-helix transcriptional regulator [Comamonas sp. Y33R10-2]
MPNTPERIIDPLDESSAFYQSGAYTPDQSIGFLMRRVLGSILQQADAQLAEHGLTYVQWLPLYKLLMDANTNSSDLAKALGMDPASVTRALDRIEAKGLLRRERSSSDRRVVHLALTQEGKRVATHVPKVLTQVLNGHLSGFSHSECTLMLSMLQRMLSNGDALREAMTQAPINIHE